MADAETPGGGFLTRWSERKCLARRGEAPPSLADADSADRTPEPADERVLTDEDMPALASLDDHSDYSGFLSPGVSEDLRRQALDRLFRSAHLNLTDGLDDYAEDFTRFVPLGDVITADLRHRMEEAAKRLLAEDKKTAAAPQEDAAHEAPDAAGQDDEGEVA